MSNGQEYEADMDRNSGSGDEAKISIKREGGTGLDRTGAMTDPLTDLLTVLRTGHPVDTVKIVPLNKEQMHGGTQINEVVISTFQARAPGGIRFVNATLCNYVMSIPKGAIPNFPPWKADERIM